jgi:hypothetical protein
MIPRPLAAGSFIVCGDRVKNVSSAPFGQEPGCHVHTGCCPNKNSFERSLKRFFANKSWRSGRSAI